MAWVLGVDLGTTFTAAAVWRDGRAEIITLGTHTAAIPSVVFYRDDGSTISGDAAEHRSVTEPERVAREFKRRVGDTTPLLVGGAPRSPEALMAVLLRDVVRDSVSQEGSRPDRIAITHPASWGPYKLDVLRQAIRLAELGTETELVPEPVAAAVHYATLQRVEMHDFVAVYDLGGGTFDAAVVRRTADGFELYGQPEGIERLGGIDVDAAVFGHVQTSLGLKLDTLDRDDPAVVSAFARLRADCVTAKETLSADTDAVIPVILPGLSTEVRITRGELESMIRPAITDTLSALRRAIASGGLVPEHVERVLLVGGSSRIPLVAEMVTADLGRPIALDTHPKHAVALGAATIASPKPVPVTPASPPPPPIVPVAAPVAPAGPPPMPPAAPVPVVAPAPGPPGPPGPPRPATRKRSPALVPAIVVVALALLVGLFAITRSSGNNKNASSSTATSGTSTTDSSSSDSSSTSSSSTDSSSSSDFPLSSASFGDTDVEATASNLIRVFFTFDDSNVDTLAARTRPLSTGKFLEQLNGFSSDFVSSAQSQHVHSSGNVTAVKSLGFDGSHGEALVTADVTVTSDNSGSQLNTFKLIMALDSVAGHLLVSDLAECPGSAGFTDSSSTALSSFSGSC
ncbi:MAG TPA: Hsp70 family protein [Acidimicrobiales bacterium]|nr:Hsp70 family protein [Acidimicrobiales bacterium]